MPARSFPAALLLLLTLPGTVSLRAGSPAESGPGGASPDEVALTTALAHLEKSGQAWIDRRGCVSCHQIPPVLWSFEAAAEWGIDDHNATMQSWETWSTDVVNFVKPHQKKDVDIPKTMSGNIDTMTQLLLAIPNREGAEWRSQFTAGLISEQQDDGSWKACGQLPLQRRDPLETHAVTTLWTTLALLKEQASFNQSAAIQFADAVPNPASTEWWAARLLVAHAADDPQTQHFQQQLLDRQHDDGGWGWLSDEDSDALGTGYALYALAVTQSEDTPVMADPIQKARAYLVSSQQRSGKWLVPGTKQAAKGKPTATANDWGTAWAALALAASQSQPKPRSNSY